MKGQSYLKGALIISFGGFVSKLLGAAYRIPLIAILGGRGMGIYQMVYPLYCILLTVSASGIPQGLARLVATGDVGAERTAFGLFCGVGVVGSAAMYLLSDALAAAMGEPAVALCCRLLSPSVFFVSVISVVRGYFQGRGNMTPTAFTEIFEQLVKVAFGVLLAYIFRADASLSVAAAVGAVTLSELFCAIVSLGIYRTQCPKRPLYATRATPVSGVLKFTLPLTLSAVASPLCQLVESIVVVNLLRATEGDATALYGIFSGCALTLVNLPISLCYGLAAASIPKIAPVAASGDERGARSAAFRAMALTLALSLPCALLLALFSPFAVRIIFSSLAPSERALLVSLVRIMAVSCVTGSLVQTSSACLTALGKPLFGMLTQWTTSAVRVALSASLVAFTPLSVGGSAIAVNCAYLVALALNLCYIILCKNVQRTGRRKYVHNLSGIRRKRRSVDACGKGGA